jgi:hypothetical protein
LGSYDTGMHVYFPGVVLTVDTSSDCLLSYESLGKSASLSSLHMSSLVSYPWSIQRSVRPLWLVPRRSHAGITSSHYPVLRYPRS